MDFKSSEIRGGEGVDESSFGWVYLKSAIIDEQHTIIHITA